MTAGSPSPPDATAGVPPSAPDPAAAPSTGTSLWSDAMRRLRRNRLALGGAAFLVLLVLSCLLLPWLLGLDPGRTKAGDHDQAPSGAHWFGTDSLGRDCAARVLVGGRMSLLIGLVGTAVVVLIGSLYGAVAGFYGGRVDEAMMRFVDFMYGIPYMLLVILFLLLFPEEMRGDNPVPVFAALGLVQWLTMARIVRGQVLTLRQREYVLAARVMGASDARIIFRHLLPNVTGPIIVALTLDIALYILAEATLSFLGFGVKPETPTWGNMLNEARTYSMTRPLLVIAPGLTITIVVLAINFIGDGLRDAFDPRSKG